jgi:hemerythrin-like domain-containing protein
MEGATTGDHEGFFTRLRSDHARLETQLRELDRVAVAASSLDDGVALAIVADTLRFMATEGARHEEREERTLFPRLRELPEFRQILAALEFQHRMNAVEGQALGECAARFAPGQRPELRRLAGRYADANRGHMIAEERALFGLAEQRLAPAVLAAMAREIGGAAPTPR